MRLEEAINGLEEIALRGDSSTEVLGIQHDSRRVKPGDIFVAVKGEQADGFEFVESAIEAGAVAVLHGSNTGRQTFSVAELVADNPREVMALLADRIYGSPSSRMKLVGITGTNGKTTTAFLVHYLLQAAWRRVGLVGTVHYFDGVEASPASRTTPESTDLQRMLAEMEANACRGAVMEVSSHALDQGRVAGVCFDVGVFTNLTPEHLDYHGNMERYFASKRLLFRQVAKLGKKKPTIVVNADDSWGRRLIKEFSGESVEVVSYGLGAMADVRASSPSYTLTGTEFSLTAAGREFFVRVPLVGVFNVYNVLAAVASARAMGLNVRESVRNLASAPQVPGRLELISESSPFQVFVDYAHTEDALENALRTVASLGKGRLITVFGCGGDRDTSKRAPMAKAAEKYSDFCIVTSDNPRGEAPQQIFDDVVRGFASSAYSVVEDRRKAISEAFKRASPGDAVVIAGKGHEDYQILGERTIEFNDRREATFLLRDMGLARTVHEIDGHDDDRNSSSRREEESCQGDRKKRVAVDYGKDKRRERR